MHGANEIAELFKGRGKTRDVRRLGVGFEVACSLETVVSENVQKKTTTARDYFRVHGRKTNQSSWLS